MANAQLREFKTLEKESVRLKRVVADLERDKLILKETFDYLKPKARRRPTCLRRATCVRPGQKLYANLIHNNEAEQSGLHVRKGGLVAPDF